ncbi:MAG: TIGR02117 family protein [Ferruginibacter sp.]
MQLFLKKSIHFIARSLVFFVAVILLYLVAAFCLSRITVNKEDSPAGDVSIFIKTNGVHTDLVVPVKNDVIDWSRTILFSNTHLKDTGNMQWLAMGWGDKGFYLQTPTWSDLKLSTAFKAAFALSTTAMHTTFYRSIKEDADCKKIMLTTEQYKRLVRYLQESFEYDTAGQMIPIITDANYSDADAFYEATGRYSLFKTCNSWANTGLKSCGQKACLWTAFDTAIFLKYK